MRITVAERSAASCLGLVPIYRWPLSRHEGHALEFLLRQLGDREIRLIAPTSLSITGLGWAIERFPDHCFANRDSYSQLLLSRNFYARFAEWEWLLIVQPDALVLGPDITPWLEQPWDYIGAPWLGPDGSFHRVGNGGLCLRRTAACIRVLEAPRPASSFAGILPGTHAPDLTLSPWPKRFFEALRIWRETRCSAAAYASRYTLNEDRFWSDRASIFDPTFRVAPVAAGLQFSFEQAPRLAYSITGKLPFGTHAWETYDRSFWLDAVPGLREELGELGQ